jgi:hypothetical protein
LPLLAEHAGPASMTFTTIPAYSGNDMATIGMRTRLVRAIPEASYER